MAGDRRSMGALARGVGAARRGVTLLEVVVCVAAVGLLCAMLAGALAESRRQASLTQNLANLQQFAGGTSSYAAEYGERFWAFSWREGHVSQFGVADSEIAAMAHQAVDILWRRAFGPDQRPDISPAANWIPSPLYSHLVLVDHLDMEVVPAFVVAPEDRELRVLQRDPLNPPDPPVRPGSTFGFRIRPFSSSYELGPAFSEADAAWVGSDGEVNRTLDQHGLPHSRYNAVEERFGSRFLSDVTFPAQKVMVYERVQRHFGVREIYFLQSEARVPLLFADGAAGVRRTGDGNAGFRPNGPFLAPSLIRYEPIGHEPPTLSGRTAETVLGHYRWTRGGLKGRDFGGPEIDTTDW